jgi:hypothetical protein
MDDRTFDGLARALARRMSRRRALAGLLGGMVAAAGIGHASNVDAARRGYSGPNLPKTVTPGPCTPFCGVQLCNMQNGCGGTCTCSAGTSCIDGSCAPPCDSTCDYCLSDGPRSGCFDLMAIDCSDNTDCQAQFGAGVCRSNGNGVNWCFVPTNLA